MSTLQKLLEAHIEKAAEKYVDQIPEDYAVTECEVEVGYKAGAQSLAPLLLAAVEALEFYKNTESTYWDDSTCPPRLKPKMCYGPDKAASALSLIAASLKREGA